MATTPKRLSALSGLFSSTVFRELAVKGKSAAFARLAREADVLPRIIGAARVRDVFETAFGLLKEVGLRDEYIYKAALTHRVLLGTHSLRTACMLSEFRAGASKADIAILNGTTTVYEIKSERDSLSRLESQIENYRKVFASVYVIAGANHLSAVLRATASDVGVMSLDRRYYMSTEREAKNVPSRIDPLTVFESLRTSEAIDLLAGLKIPIPSAPNTRLRGELRKLFEALPPEDVHAGMLRTLKRTRTMLPLSELVDLLPGSLQAAALSVPLRRGDHERLVATIDAPLKQALAWV